MPWMLNALSSWFIASNRPLSGQATISLSFATTTAPCLPLRGSVRQQAPQLVLAYPRFRSALQGRGFWVLGAHRGGRFWRSVPMNTGG